MQIESLKWDFSDDLILSLDNNLNFSFMCEYHYLGTNSLLGDSVNGDRVFSSKLPYLKFVVNGIFFKFEPLL